MKISFLGTGTSQGVPIIGCQCKVCLSPDHKDKRLRSSILISSENTRITIDCTPDFRYQMLREQVRDIDGIVFTHEHQDHVAGLDDVRAINFINNKDMPIWGNKRVLKRLKKMYDYAFLENKYPGVPKIELIEINEESVFNVGDIEIQCIGAWHGDWPVLGFRVGDLVYLTDVNRIDSQQMEKIKGCKTLIVSALRREKHHSHFSLAEAVDFIENLNVNEGYLTHISHQMGKHKDVSTELPSYIKLAHDGLELEL